jgi:dTDP-4-amino-4,6-dideoxygalactose transaminase
MLANRPARWGIKDWMLIAAPKRPHATDHLRECIAQWYPSSQIFPVNAGRTALRLALRLAQQRNPRRSTVLVPDYICPSVPEAIAAEGLVSRPCPTNAQLVLDEEATIAAMSDSVLAIIVVHMYGYPAPMGRIEAEARRLGIAVIDDAAQVFGAAYDDGLALGARGDFGILSFALFKTICIGTSGMGGVLLVNEDSWKDAATAAVGSLPASDRRPGGDFLLLQATGREFPTLRWYAHRLLGGGSERCTRVEMAAMPPVGAALAVSQMKRVPELMVSKAMTLEAFRLAFTGMQGVRLPQLDRARYLTRVMVEVGSQELAERLRTVLRAKRIPAKRPYPWFDVATTPNCRPGLLELPSGPSVNRRTVERIRDVVRRFLCDESNKPTIAGDQR